MHSIFNAGYGEFSYIDWKGTGPLAYINHAIGYCAGVYTPFALKLTQSLTVVGLDFRGHGATMAPADPAKLKNWQVLYEDFERFIVYLNKPAIVIGHSMGGTIGMMAAVRRPDLVRALIMIEPGIMPPSWIQTVALLQRMHLTGISPLVSKTAKKNNVWPNRETFRKSYINKNPFCRWRNDFFDAFLTHAMKDEDAGSVRLCCNPRWEARCIATAPTDVWKYVPLIRTPVMVIYGSRTNTFLPEVVKRLQNTLPRASLKCFNDTGHDVIMERPDESARAILDFLSQNGLA